MQCLTTWVVRSVDEVRSSHHDKTELTASDPEQAKDDFKNRSNNPINSNNRQHNPDPISANVVPRLLLPFLNFKARQ